jgi:pimeloyl-ACP methyl ester carboxylesterase
MKKIFTVFLSLTLSFTGLPLGMQSANADALTINDPEAYAFVLATFIQIPCQEEDYDEGRCDRREETYYDYELEEEVACTEEDYVDETCYAGTTTYQGVEEHERIHHGDVVSIEFGKLYDALSFVLSDEVDLGHNFFFSYTELFYLPEGVGGPRELRQEILDIAEGFSEEGIYEIDVYGSIGGVSYAPSFIERLARMIVPYAYAEGTDGGNGPYLTTVRFEIKNINTVAGNPSVLFLPGTQASRLYDGDDGNRLWEPSGNIDVGKLTLDASGNSIKNVQTKDVIDEIDVVPFLQSNIYKGFMSYLDGLVDEEVIEVWEPYAYDWRKSVFDVVENGSTYYDGTTDGEQKYLVNRVEELAANSQNGKVAIIGHSNGGLLAKALMMKLEEEGKDNLIDSVIFVATPHLGTPKAIATVLHGHDQEKVGGLLVDDEVAREVIKNMPGAYALLPSEKYMEVSSAPLVTFGD